MNAAEQVLDPPRRLRDIELAERYAISRRLAGEWIRAAIAAGVVKKLGRFPVARLSALDAWVAAGDEIVKGGRR